jgi:molybdenum cofactor cytidylyltransferase
MGEVTGIVLAAGASERMGEPKLVLPYAGTTILKATLGAVLVSRVDGVVVVTGTDADVVEATLEYPSIVVVRNPDPRRGNMSSLLTATDLDTDAGAFILVAGDIPTITTASIDAMVDLWVDARPWAAVTLYRDRISHPILLSRAAVDETRAIEGSKVLWRALVESGDNRVVRVDAPGDAPPDINTRQDYEALLEGTR